MTIGYPLWLQIVDVIWAAGLVVAIVALYRWRRRIKNGTGRAVDLNEPGP